MKKLLFAVCAVAALSLAACHKDPVTPDNQGGGGNQQEEQIPEGEGIYNPGMHIAAIYYNDGTPSEIWRWENRKLVGIDSSDYCGGSSPVSTFSYNGWRLAQATTMVQGIPAMVTYSYNGDKLASMDINSQGMPIANIQVGDHTGDKVTHLDINLNNQLLQMLVSMMGDTNMPFPFKGMKEPGKFSLTSTDFDVDLTWSGDNVSRVILSGEVVMGATVEELQQFMPLDSVMGPLVSLLSYMTEGQELPLTIYIHDTIQFNHDSYNNPLHGFLGRLDLSALSANNVVSQESHVGATVVLTVSIPSMSWLGSHDFSYDLPVDGNTTTIYNYTYNAAGYPATVEDSEGKQTTFNYQEQ